MAVTLTLRTIAGQTLATHRIGETPLSIRAQEQVQYHLADAGGLAPANVQAARAGNDLLVSIDGEAALRIEDYFLLDDSGLKNPLLGLNGNGQYVAYAVVESPTTLPVEHLLAEEVAAVSGSESASVSALTAFGLGTLALGGLALASNSGSDDSRADNGNAKQPQTPPAPNPPATNPPATNPPATNPPATNPPATNPPAPNPPAPNPPAPNPPATNPPAPNPPATNPPATNPPAPNPPAPNPPPKPNGGITISGSPKVGSTLVANISDPDGLSGSPRYQWLADGKAIQGATQSTYTVSQADIGKAITVQATYTDNAQVAEKPLSPATGQVIDETPPPPQNHAPSDITLSADRLPENQAGAIIGKLTTVDEDKNDQHTYRISDDRFEVDAQGKLKLKDGVKVEFGNEQTINLDITTSDGKGGSYSETFTINVQDDPAYPAPNPPPTPPANDGKLGVYVPKPKTDFIANVKDAAYGAKGDGKTDDTAAIQKAINAVAEKGGGIVDIPGGTYLINPLKSLRMASNVIVRMADDTVVKSIANENSYSSVFLFRDVQNAHLLGGTLIGDRGPQHDELDQWSHGVNIVSSQNVVIENVTSRDMQGHGFSISRVYDDKTQPENIVLYNVKADNNYVAGVMVTDGKGIKILNSELTRTNGFDSQAAINLEPNFYRNISDVEIRGNLFKDNIDQAVMLSMVTQPDAYLRDVRIDDNTLINNGRGINVWGYLTGGSISGNTIHYQNYPNSDTQPPYALLLGYDSKNLTVTNNTLHGGMLYAEYNRQDPTRDPLKNNTVADNIFKAGVIIEGDLKSGETVRAIVIDGDNKATLGRVLKDQVKQYQWFADGQAISGATAAEYQIRAADNGKILSVRATFTDAAGNEEQAESLPGIAVGGEQPNRRPTDIRVDGNELMENRPGAIIGKVQVIDPDKEDSYTYKFFDPRFEVKDGYLKLKDGKSVSLANEKSIEIVFAAFDKGGVSHLEYHTVKVLDDPDYEGQANRAPTDIILSNTSVMENRPGAIVGKIDTIDPDFGDGHRYNLSVGKFTVQDGYLKLHPSQSLDYSTDRITILNITSTDDLGAKISKTFRIDVQDDPAYPVTSADTAAPATAAAENSAAKLLTVRLEPELNLDHAIQHGTAERDIFVLDSECLGEGGCVQTIHGFNISHGDVLQLESQVFTALEKGALAPDAFAVGSQATSADHRVMYNANTGELAYDPDGSGAANATLVARLDPALELEAQHIQII